MTENPDLNKQDRSLSDDQIVTERVLPRRSFLSKSGLLLAGAAGIVSGARAMAQQDDPSKRPDDQRKPDDKSKPDDARKPDDQSKPDDNAKPERRKPDDQSKPDDAPKKPSDPDKASEHR